ncbi:hypothetical protein RMT89_39640, partial [Streptomyces sp. P17]|nr:hypothetical protein [Streptomyces sp. P17]
MNPRLTLTASVAGAVIVALDGTVLTIAQPALQRDLGASHAQIQWTGTGYLVAVASLLVIGHRRLSGGRLGHRIGHRRQFGGRLGHRIGHRRLSGGRLGHRIGHRRQSGGRLGHRIGH